MASDSAVPGDWNYGIDRALEAVGIGAGGAAERLQELAAIRANGHPSGAESAPQTGPTTPPDVGGLENAAATVAEIIGGSQRASDVRTGVSVLLAYLADTEAADGPIISELAQQFKQAHQLSRSNRPEVNPGEQHRPDLPGAADFRQSSLDRPLVTRQGAAEAGRGLLATLRPSARGHEPR